MVINKENNNSNEMFEKILDNIKIKDISFEDFIKNVKKLSEIKYNIFDKDGIQKIRTYFKNILLQYKFLPNELKGKNIFDLEKLIIKNNIKTFKIERNNNIKEQFKNKRNIIWNFGNIFTNEIQLFFDKEKNFYTIYSPYYKFNIELDEEKTIIFLETFLLIKDN